MSQRDSGYARKERDLYETPEWVTETLLRHMPLLTMRSIWEPAAASGKMADVLARHGYGVVATDIVNGSEYDFLAAHDAPGIAAIITNPPYESAEMFIRKALELMCPVKGATAMLLRTDYDHARTRQDLFTIMPFAKKLVLTKRIKWFEDSKGQPSFNHAWFIWDWKHKGPPTIAYGP